MNTVGGRVYIGTYQPHHRRRSTTMKNPITRLWAAARRWLDLDSESFDETQDDSWGHGEGK